MEKIFIVDTGRRQTEGIVQAEHVQQTKPDCEKRQKEGEQERSCQLTQPGLRSQETSIPKPVEFYMYRNQAGGKEAEAQT